MAEGSKRRTRSFDWALCEGCGVTLDWLALYLGGATCCCDDCAHRRLRRPRLRVLSLRAVAAA